MSWQPWAAAAFAPAAVWVLWRFQILGVELLRTRLVLLVRNPGQRWLYAIVSWFGTLLHEISHASVLLLSGHGIRSFKAGVEQGHVVPSRMRGGAGLLFFLVAALAPLFIPPALALAGLVWLVDRSLLPDAVAGPGLHPAALVLREVFVTFPERLALALARLDLARPLHLATLLLVLVGIPGSRPSHVKGSRFHGKDDEGDIPALRRRIRSNPLPFLAFLLVLYGAYFALVPRWPRWYWLPFEAVWAVALTGILLALFGAVWWSLAALGGRTWFPLSLAGPAAFALVQVGARTGPWAGSDPSIPAINLVALGAWAAVAVACALALPRRR
jgi:hypothetical protein